MKPIFGLFAKERCGREWRRSIDRCVCVCVCVCVRERERERERESECECECECECVCILKRSLSSDFT